MGKGIPEGLHTVTPALTVDGAGDAIDFYARAFGAVEVSRAPDPSGKKIWHAQIRIGDSTLYVNDVFPEMGGAPRHATLWIYCADADAAFERAVGAGATVKMPPADMFWGDRMCSVADRWGQEWMIATRKKTLSPEEMAKAQEAAVAAWKAKAPG
jgi:uncharacterized glyoxalase superfamily protein PhnB